MAFSRPHAAILARRLAEPRRFIQAVTGPRQVGKTTLVQHVTAASGLPTRFAAADEPTLRGPGWLEQQWEAARLEARDAGRRGALLVLDEIQKVPGWSEAVKRLWDEDTRLRRALKVVILGSAPLLVQRGLAESLAGRFEVCKLFYWRDRNREVDFVARAGRTLTAIEVKSGRSREVPPGLLAFAEVHGGARTLLVGGDGIAIGEFLARPVEHWVRG